MPFEYHIDVNEKFISIVARGKIDFSQGLELGEALPCDPAFSSEYPLLMDFREMDFDPEIEAAREFAETLPRLRPWYQGKIALVTSPGFIHQVARFVAVLATAGGFPMEPFESLDEARSWIEQPESAA